MGWGRSSSRDRDYDGWSTVRGRDSRNRWNRWGGGGGGGGGGNRGGADKLMQENDELRKELKDAQRAVSVAGDRTHRPNARDSSGRHGDWMCMHCMFKSNRAARAFCYRCTAPKSDSHGKTPGAATIGSTASATPPTTPPTTPTATTYTATSTLVSPPAQPGLCNPEAAKSIRQRITALEAARNALAGCSGCEAERTRLDHDLATARLAWAAHLPVEVAVKGTLGTATQARAAVTKAEAKVARLETQLTSAVDQYDAAMAELGASRAKLAEAEAATAKAASIALPPEHYLAAVATDPGPFWSAFKSVIVQKCPGLPADFLGQLDNVTKAFEAVIEPIFLATGNAATPHAATGSESQDLPVAPTTPTLPPTDDVNQPSAKASMQPAPTAPIIPTPTSAEEAIALAWSGQLTASPQAQRPTPHSGTEAGQSAATAAANTTAAAQQQNQHSQQQLAALSSTTAADAARALLAVTAAAVAAPVDDIDLAMANHPVDNGAHGGGVTNSSVAESANDPMGGGAADGVVNKRGIAEVAAAARAVAAKAKARQP